MTILIATDKFKGTLSAEEACAAIELGISKIDPSIQTIKIPLADGGEGSINTIRRYKDVEEKSVLVKDPLGRTITAHYLKSEDGDAAYIEMAAASGLGLLSHEEQNPLYTSTFGTGEMILDAISHGVKEVYIFLGGSATNDMGIGMAEALGYEFRDRDGDEVPPVGLSMAFIMEISKVLKYRKSDVNFYAVCDVNNSLYGKNGAAYVYGAQKGADKYAIQILDKGLRKMSKRCKKFLNKDIAKIPGAGAAGGLGAGVLAFLDGEIVSGIDFIKDISRFDAVANDVDLIITGEGSIDNQSLNGKVLSGVLASASIHDIPVVALCGQNKLIDKEIKGLITIHDLVSAYGLQAAISNTKELLQNLVVEKLSDRLNKIK